MLATTNPTLPMTWGIGSWVTGIIHVALVVWAVVEVVRAGHMNMWVRVALGLLALVMPVLGPLLAILAVRTSRTAQA